MSSAVAAEIKQRVISELGQLPPHLRQWAEHHVVSPKTITALLDPAGPQTVQLWLVTDDIGKSDGSDRIVFDTRANCFGRLTTLADGRLWYQGPQEGGVANAVQGL